MPLRVVLVDDDQRFRTMAHRALAAEGVDVVAEVGDATGAAQAVATWQPDVVLIDIRMPGIGGVEVARQLREQVDGPVVILISTIDLAYGRRLAAGVAAGYLPKDEISLAAIRELVPGS